MPEAYHMSGLKKLWAITGLAALLPATAVAGPDLHDLFATCTGRLSAQMEHQWLLRDGASSVTERHRASMIAVLDALTTEENAAKALSIRINSKYAQAALLSRATFNRDAGDAEWAGRKADRDVATCLILILPDPTPADRQAGADSLNPFGETPPAQYARVVQD
jgi:hypothetical protein